MTRSLRARFFLDMSGNLGATARRFGRDFRRLGDTGDRQLGRVGRAADRANRSLNRGLVRGAAVVTAAIVAGGVLTGRRVADLQERLERFGAAASKSTEEMQAFREELNKTANAPDVRIKPDELLAAIVEFQKVTGDFDMGEKISREMALTIQATGEAGEEIGKLFAVLNQKFDLKDPAQAIAAVGTLTRQGYDGSVEISDQASVAGKVYTAYSRFGQKGVGGVARAGALMQIFGKAAPGEADVVATIFQSIMNNLLEAGNIKKLRKVGIKTRDEAGELRDPFDVLRETVASAKGDPESPSEKFLNLCIAFAPSAGLRRA